MVEKARALAADELVFDLEDAVAPDAKASARDALVTVLADPAWGDRSIAVRVNATSDPHVLRDVLALAGAGGDRPASLVVPKVESVFDLLLIDRIVTLLEQETGRVEPIGLQALIETPLGLRRIDEIVSASERLETLIIGYADLGATLGRPPATRAPDDRWLWVQETVLSAARGAGIQAIDGPWLAIPDVAGFEASVRRARELGFDGKWALHPTQIDLLNELFAPSPAEFAHAVRLLDALAQAERHEGRGAVLFDGVMIDEASRKHAQRIVAGGRAAGLQI